MIEVHRELIGGRCAKTIDDARALGKRLAFRLGAAGLGLLLGACLPTPAHISQDAGKATVQGYSCLTPECFAESNTKRLTQEYQNATFRGNSLDRSFTWSYREEQEYTRDNRWPPRLCLAMSGGGLRSAAVNIGVLGSLYALKDPQGKPLLDRIDVLSGVSGGSSALAWYFAQHRHLDAAPATSGREDPRSRMFADEISPGPPRQHQDYLAHHYVTFTTFAYGVGGAMNFSFIPVNLFANGLFGWHANTSPMRGWYESRLRQTFLTDPRGGDSSRAGSAISLPDLGAVARNYRLPLFVISATALIERDVQHFGARLGNTVFEFTPRHFGSDAFGRHPYDTDAGKEFSLSRVVSISSAAFDGALLVSGPTQTTLWSAANWDTGMYVNNPNLSSNQRFWHRWLPFPTYFTKNYLRDIDGTDIYLSDGGHAENLAVYPLVRRGCAKILVVDAEHDPGFIFESYRRLQQNLRAEVGAALDVSEITKILAIENHDPRGPRWVRAANQPVMHGTLSRIPHRRAGGDMSDQIDILYLKMAYMPEMTVPAESLPPDDPLHDQVVRRRADVRRVFEQDRLNSCTLDRETGLYLEGTCPFPHRTTKDQSFTPLEYRAWRNLGYLLTIGYANTVRDFMLDR